MSLIVRAVLAIILGVLATRLLEYFNILNHSLDVLIGIAVAIVFYFGYGDINTKHP